MAAIEVIPATLIKALPVRSPNLETNVSIKTDDLYLSFFFRVLKIISLEGLFRPYSNTLKITVTTATAVIDGEKP